MSHNQSNAAAPPAACLPKCLAAHAALQQVPAGRSCSAAAVNTLASAAGTPLPQLLLRLGLTAAQLVLAPASLLLCKRGKSAVVAALVTLGAGL